ncbi:hypothetical protein DVH24_020194 [Malus domestica]|uniref:Uncharacterized protein n=1 Tax=Malus domestica TaxID=3750 RepID=A0A498JCR8_MALDO|nr:hypothetical protein DVH24_020194 [Malus domestica]
MDDLFRQYAELFADYLSKSKTKFINLHHDGVLVPKDRLLGCNFNGWSINPQWRSCQNLSTNQ